MLSQRRSVRLFTTLWQRYSQHLQRYSQRCGNFCASLKILVAAMLQ